MAPAKPPDQYITGYVGRLYCSTRIRGIPTELPLGTEVGLEHDSVAQLDSAMPVLKSSLHRHLGSLGIDAHADLCRRLAISFGCE